MKFPDMMKLYKGCTFIFILVASSFFGYIGKPTEMGLAILAGAIALAFANIDKIRRDNKSVPGCRVYTIHSRLSLDDQLSFIISCLLYLIFIFGHSALPLEGLLRSVNSVDATPNSPYSDDF